VIQKVELQLIVTIILKNVADMPTEQDWLTYAEWGRKWGPFLSLILLSVAHALGPGGIVHISLFGQSMIIINSVAAMDEFDKAGSVYSDRPVLQMGGEMIGFNEILLLVRYGPKFRTYRKHFSRYLGSGKPIQNLHPIIEEETCRFLKRVTANCEALNQQLRMYGIISPFDAYPILTLIFIRKAGGVILRATYGYEVKDVDDDYVALINRANTNFNRAGTPGAFLVDALPFLKYLPEWLPGTGFLALAKEWKKATMDMAEIPYSFTKKQMVWSHYNDASMTSHWAGTG